MNASSSKQTSAFEDDEIFDDSIFLANFDNTSLKQLIVSENNANNSINTSALNVSALCCDEEISGYDKITGQTWIYPTNYPVRDYQFNIINAALVKNTLVSLPTGLGKTFIAAVIMYNFYRWYPLGKIVFMAPTRPLVAQQIEACYNIVAIPPMDTIEMTGHMQATTRKTHWQNKRVFFATPQVIYNDLKSGICPADKIRCLVVDEAHRARGNYAYCSIIGTLDDLGQKTYRLLALSATPGSKVEDVVSVVKSLHIAHLELRTENCIDVAPYSHSRKISTEVIQLGPELTQLRHSYVEILDGYARRLKQFNILPQNLGNLSKGRVVMLYKEYQSKERGSRHPQHNFIMKDFTLLIALYHGLELLVKHGSRVFLNFFDEHPEKTWIQADDRLTALLERLRDDLGVNPMALDTSILPDGTTPDIPKDLCFGHPKFDRLKAIMVEHFTNAKNKGQDTRAIVFCEYRESVNLVHCLLLQCRPLISPQMFVGQGAGGKGGKTVVSQKQQLRVMNSFRSGVCNALVATCVAEEGLDVGSVDLILCFDISTRSPVRLVQRCGRTGRERGGQVFILVTEGREHQTLMDCMRQRDGLNNKIQQSREVQNNLYKLNPRMMPHGFTPACQKMHITVTLKPDTKEKPKKVRGQHDLRSMLTKKTNATPLRKETRKRVSSPGLSDDEEFNVGYRDTEIVIEDSPPLAEPTEPVLINSQATPAQIATSPVKTKKIKKKLKGPVKSPAKNCGDIRALFSTATKSTRNYTKLINELGIPNDGSIPTRLINLLVDLNLNNSEDAKSCYICRNICDCKLMKQKDENKPVLIKFVNEPFLPNLDLIDDIDVEAIMNCNKSIEKTQDIVECRKDVSFSKENVDKANCSGNFDLEFDFDDLDEIGSPEGNSINITEIVPSVIEKEDKETIVDKNFDLGDIDDIFADSPELIENEPKNVIDAQNERKPDEALGFFGLDSIDDIFADSDDSVIMVSPEHNKPEKVDAPKRTQTIKDSIPNSAYPLSPSILSGKICKIRPTSPILCSQLSSKKTNLSRSLPFSIKNKRIPVSTPSNDNEQKSKIDTTDKSMFTITQLVDMINKTSDNSVADHNCSKTETNAHNSKAKYNLSTNEITDILDDDRSNSPILLTQADRKRLTNSNSTENKMSQYKSLIILDSDSDSNTTISYDVETEVRNAKENTKEMNVFGEKLKNTGSKLITAFKDIENETANSSSVGKRKFEEDSDLITASPYFNKKQKLESETTSTLQQKVIAAITSNKNKQFNNNQTTFQVTVSQPNFSQKENSNPHTFEVLNKGNEEISSSPLDKLQKFKKDNKILTLRRKFNTIFKKSPKKSPVKILQQRSPNKIEFGNDDFVDYFSPEKTDFRTKRPTTSKKILFEDSDDDFVNGKSGSSSPSPSCKSSPVVTANKDKHIRPPTNHKVRKKRPKHNSLLDMEAVLSESDSGDELSDDSVGSMAEFLCDEEVTHHEDVDMRAHYLKSVRSPVRKNGFKIPELPKKYNKVDVFSQFVQEDAYEMDSFCVDSHIGLTQVNDVSELEIAEMLLKERKKRKKQRSPSPEQNESPVVKRKYKKVNTLESDSEDST